MPGCIVRIGDPSNLQHLTTGGRKTSVIMLHANSNRIINTNEWDWAAYPYKLVSTDIVVSLKLVGTGRVTMRSIPLIVIINNIFYVVNGRRQLPKGE